MSNTNETVGADIIYLRDHEKHEVSEITACIKCGGQLGCYLPMSCFIQDGREKLCQECFLDRFRPRGLLGGRPHTSWDDDSETTPQPFGSFGGWPL